MMITISDQSQIAAARRAAEAQARRQGFGNVLVGRVGLVATEMATNMLKHAAHGYLIAAGFADGTGSGVEFLACDNGPGIANVQHAFEDGYSSVGTAGTGLEAIRRQADLFDIFSRPGAGTVVMARVRDDNNVQPSASLKDIEIGAVIVPHPGEIECGDSWTFAVRGGAPSLFAIDASGHGSLAATAASVAVRTFDVTDEASGVRLIETVHRALAPTRGGAVAVAQVDVVLRVVRFVGLGNIAAALLADGGVKRMVSHNGTAGQVAARIREFTYPFARSPMVILHSDGLSAKWDLDAYPGLASCHPSTVAGVLSRDFRRANDDAMIVVMRVKV